MTGFRNQIWMVNGTSVRRGVDDLVLFDRATPFEPGRRHRLTGLLFICLAPLIIMSFGCRISRDRADSERAVSQFHFLFDSGRYADIYRDSDQQLHASMSEPQFTETLRAIRTKLGSVRASEIRAWNVNVGTQGAFSTTEYGT